MVGRKHVAWAQGVQVRMVDGKAVTPKNLRFMGVPPRIPNVQVGDPYRERSVKK
jgi:hypothetical protein